MVLDEVHEGLDAVVEGDGAVVDGGVHVAILGWDDAKGQRKAKMPL